MFNRNVNLIGQLLPLLILLLINPLLTQEYIGGKLIKQEIWKNEEIEYIEGEIALILNLGVSKDDILPRSNCDHHSRKNNNVSFHNLAISGNQTEHYLG